MQKSMMTIESNIRAIEVEVENIKKMDMEFNKSIDENKDLLLLKENSSILLTNHRAII
jgi:hypothetical protein